MKVADTHKELIAPNKITKPLWMGLGESTATAHQGSKNH